MSGEPNFDDLFASIDVSTDTTSVLASGEAVTSESDSAPRRGRRSRTVVSDDPPEDAKEEPAVEAKKEEPKEEPKEESPTPESTQVRIITPDRAEILPAVSAQTLLEMETGHNYLKKRGAI